MESKSDVDLITRDRRDTVGFDEPVDSSRNFARQPVVSKNVVNACKILRVAFSRRADARHILTRFDEARSRISSSASSTDGGDASLASFEEIRRGEDAAAAAAAGGGAARGSGGFGSGLGSGRSASQAARKSRVDLEQLQRARTILLRAASPSPQKVIFGQVPPEWLAVFEGFCKFWLFLGMLCLIPCFGLQMDCSNVGCRPTNNTGNTSRANYLHSTPNGDWCPFDSWTHALFGIWIIVIAAGVLGAVFSVWAIGDKFFSPFARFFRASRQTFVATLSTVPLLSRLFVVAPPLCGLGVTGILIYSRMNTPTERLTWSWLLIAAPALIGFCLALVLKMWVSWKFMEASEAPAQQAQNASTADSAGQQATAAQAASGSHSILPAWWAKRLLAADALAMTVAAFTSPIVLSIMMDCDGYTNWSAFFFPLLVFMGISALITIIELLYRACLDDERARLFGGGGGEDEEGGDGTAGRKADEEDDEDEIDEMKRDPLWKESLSLFTRHAGIIAGTVLCYLKIEMPGQFGHIRWFYAVIPYIFYCFFAFCESILTMRSALRKSKKQFVVLEELMTPTQILEESLASGYGAAALA